MLSIGDKVLFSNWEQTRHIPSFFAEDRDIPKEMIIHGNTYQMDSENGGIVEGFYGKYVIVSFLDKENEKTQLGFMEDNLIPISSEPQYEIY